VCNDASSNAGRCFAEWGVQTDRNVVNVIGQRLSPALNTVDEQLSAKAAEGVLYIVHGIGTGVLREEIHNMLASDKRVRAFKLEEKSAGGCTIVKLR
jgi:DNA mismatch repair protein MutS2